MTIAISPILSLEDQGGRSAGLSDELTEDEVSQHRARVRAARVELAQQLVDAARALRRAETLASTLGVMDHDHCPASDLRRAIGQSLTGVHAAKYLAPPPEQPIP